MSGKPMAGQSTLYVAIINTVFAVHINSGVNQSPQQSTVTTMKLAQILLVTLALLVCAYAVENNDKNKRSIGGYYSGYGTGIGLGGYNYGGLGYGGLGYGGLGYGGLGYGGLGYGGLGYNGLGYGGYGGGLGYGGYGGGLGYGGYGGGLGYGGYSRYSSYGYRGYSPYYGGGIYGRSFYG